MPENKTKQTKASVATFLKSITDPGRRKDCETVIALMKKVTKCDPVMWGTSIVGFGTYHYKYESGREGDSMILGFSPRKNALTLYLRGGLDRSRDLLGDLGKHKTGGGCLYIGSLEGIDLKVLEKILKISNEVPAHEG